MSGSRANEGAKWRPRWRRSDNCRPSSRARICSDVRAPRIRTGAPHRQVSAATSSLGQCVITWLQPGLSEPGLSAQRARASLSPAHAGTCILLPGMSRLRIGIDARLRAYRRGGIARHVECLVDGLQQLELEEDLLLLLHRRDRAAVPPAAGDLVPPSQAAAAARRELADQTTPGHAPPLPRSGWPGRVSVRRLLTPPHHRYEDFLLPPELLRHRVELFHATDFIVPSLWRRAAVATVHDLAFLRHPEFLTPASARYYGRVGRTVGRAERVIAVSEHTRRELIELTEVHPEHIRVVPNALHPAFLKPRVVAAERAAVERCGVREPYLLFVSTIEPRKNVITLLDAYRGLLDQGHQVELVLVGADGWKSQLVYEHARQLGLTGRARFLGFVPDDILVAFYRRAAALAHPAHDEGFGFAPLEAMASGTPVVIADAGAPPEVVGQAGVLVPPTDPGAWTLALARVLTDRSLASQLVAAGLERAAAFTTRRMAERTVAVYREAWGVSRHFPQANSLADAGAGSVAG